MLRVDPSQDELDIAHGAACEIRHIVLSDGWDAYRVQTIIAQRLAIQRAQYVIEFAAQLEEQHSAHTEQLVKVLEELEDIRSHFVLPGDKT